MGFILGVSGAGNSIAVALALRPTGGGQVDWKGEAWSRSSNHYRRIFWVIDYLATPCFAI